jgi:hypothetical protein
MPVLRGPEEGGAMQEQEQVTCGQCGRTFGSQEELDRHIEQEHGRMGGDGLGGGMGDEDPDAVSE